MKIILKLKWIFLILILINCKEQNTKEVSPSKITSNNTITNVESKDERYVGKGILFGE